MGEFGNGDFEFERRFFVSGLPQELLAEPIPTLIFQSYYLAAEGYAMRVRAQSSQVLVHLDENSDPLTVLADVRDQLDFAGITVKGPAVNGTRYEVERELDPEVAAEMIRLGGHQLVKNRYSIWLGSDGWVVDVFGGTNAPLVIAEVERAGPVTDLEIPGFCVSEVTADRRFANEELSGTPYSTWADSYLRELELNGPKFLQGLGRNVFNRAGDQRFEE